MTGYLYLMLTSSGQALSPFLEIGSPASGLWPRLGYGVPQDLGASCEASGRLADELIRMSNYPICANSLPVQKNMAPWLITTVSTEQKKM